MGACTSSCQGDRTIDRSETEFYVVSGLKSARTIVAVPAGRVVVKKIKTDVTSD
jgi:hypothetical protein